MLRVKRFWTEYRTPKAGGEMKAIDWVELQAIGDDKTTAIHMVRDITPPADLNLNNVSHAALNARWETVGPLYEAWKKGEDLPETGTPLAAWSGISPEQADALKQMNIRTVEEVAQLTEGVIEKLRFPHARKLPELAKQYVEGIGDAAKDAEIAELKEQMAAMMDLLEEGKGKKKGKAA